MTHGLKDRVVLIEQDIKKAGFKVKGTIVKLYKGKKGSIKTCGVLWDNEWPVTNSKVKNDRYTSGKIFYYKPEDLNIVDTWSLD